MQNAFGLRSRASGELLSPGCAWRRQSAARRARRDALHREILLAERLAREIERTGDGPAIARNASFRAVIARAQAQLDAM